MSSVSLTTTNPKLTGNDNPLIVVCHKGEGISRTQDLENHGEDCSLSWILDCLDPVPPLQMYPATVELYRQGGTPDDVYLLEDGLAKLVRIEPDGKELIFALRFPGALLGNFSAIINRPYPLTAITLINSRLRRIPTKTFRDLLQSNVELSWHLHQLHSEIVFENTLRFAQLSLITARQRLEQLLWQFVLAQKADLNTKDLWLKIPLKYWELAALIAVSPAYLSRLFAALETDGILLRNKGRLIVRNPRALWRETDA